MKVALISNSPPVAKGGAYTSTELLFKGLQAKGLEVDVFSTDGMNKKCQKNNQNEFTIPGSQAYDFPPRIGLNIGVYSHTPDLDEYDVVHIYGSGRAPGVILRKLRENTSTPIITSFNNLNWVCTNWSRYLRQGCPKYDLRETIEYSYAEGFKLQLPLKVTLEEVSKRLVKCSDIITTQTTGMADILSNCGYSRSDIKIIPNLADNRFCIDSKENSRHTLLFAGRLIERKGVLDIIEAFINIQDEISDSWTLKILGWGDLESKVKACIADIENITLDKLPYKQLPEEYAKASVLVHGSKYPEPFSRTWLEAMASETAIVASQNPSSQAVLSEFAELYNPFDLTDLQSTLRSVLEDESKQDKMRKQGKIAIEQYQPKKVINQYMHIYSDLCN